MMSQPTDSNNNNINNEQQIDLQQPTDNHEQEANQDTLMVLLMNNSNSSRDNINNQQQPDDEELLLQQAQDKKNILRRLTVLQCWNLVRFALTVVKIPYLIYATPYFAHNVDFLDMFFTFFIWAGMTLVMVVMNLYLLLYFWALRRNVAQNYPFISNLQDIRLLARKDATYTYYDVYGKFMEHLGLLYKTVTWVVFILNVFGGIAIFIILPSGVQAHLLNNSGPEHAIMEIEIFYFFFQMLISFFVGIFCCESYAAAQFLIYATSGILFIVFWPIVYLFDECAGEKRFATYWKLESMSSSSSKIAREQECPICLQKFVRDEVITELPCHKTHIFHLECALLWWKDRRSCPICKKKYVFAEKYFFFEKKHGCRGLAHYFVTEIISIWNNFCNGMNNCKVFKLVVYCLGNI